MSTKCTLQLLVSIVHWSVITHEQCIPLVAKAQHTIYPQNFLWHKGLHAFFANLDMRCTALTLKWVDFTWLVINSILENTQTDFSDRRQIGHMLATDWHAPDWIAPWKRQIFLYTAINTWMDWSCMHVMSCVLLHVYMWLALGKPASYTQR